MNRFALFFRSLHLASTLASAFLTIALAMPAAAQEKITIGLVPEMNVFAQFQRYKPLADHIRKETGISVELSILNRYTNVIEELRSRRIDASFMGSLTAAVAITYLQFIPVARPVNLDNSSEYHGKIFARKDSKISTFADMRGKTIAFVEHATTAGYLFPLTWLRKHGVEDYTTFFGDHFFAGSHDAAIEAVLNGKADIGAAKNTIYELFLKNNPRARNELEIIASSVPVPSNGLCVSPDTPTETVAKLRAVLVGLDKTPAGKEVLKHLHALQFVETKAEDYTPVFDMAEEAGVSLESYLRQAGTGNR